ncbi:hypothetical protein, partial [Aeromonas veronii]|uniref:hypothetical protein n=1 Tax=Aeromonas veronii TaxID=654 RepID=UPI003BA1FA45
SVSHLVPSGSLFIGGKGVNHIQDGTADAKRPLIMSGLFQFGGPGVSDLTHQVFDFIEFEFLA